jgi:hypothetical protein
MPLLFSSCEEEEEPFQITGNSGLRVKNQSSVEAKIYFDGDFIGKVQEDKSRDWNVPVGSHKVKADCSYKGCVKKSAYFPQDGIIEMTLYEKFNSIIITPDYKNAN